MTKKIAGRTAIEHHEEPEIQYMASPELMDEIREWLLARGGQRTKIKPKTDHATYYDTKNFRLLREGIEYRIKEKGKLFRHDMKTPCDTHAREVVPDDNNILRRTEIKFETSKQKPRLANFFGEALLRPVQQRVYRFFEKELEAKCTSEFVKEKIDYETTCNTSRIEYSFQTGCMKALGGAVQTPPLYIVELELRDGDMAGLIEEKATMESLFMPKGLRFLEKRKLLMGMELLMPTMDEKQRHAFTDARERNTCRKAGRVMEQADFAAILPAAA